MKMAKAMRSGNSPKSSKSIGYLFQKGPSNCLIDQSIDPNYQAVLEAFEHLARRYTLETYDKLVQRQQQGRSYEHAWNETAVDLCKVRDYRTSIVSNFLGLSRSCSNFLSPDFC